ncbi:hypothetical protein, partial [Streptomyces sp. UNOC14_S4]|uniref:hypothetical protein n=1 Tax=Streptomyces sp. UNOC14_S4 TaxID=2872340 RepID=UPI001E330987
MDLTIDISVEDGRDPDVDARLTEELFAGLPVPAPDMTETDAREHPAWFVVARRPDGGGLLGWAEAYERRDGTSEADVQWLVVSRERERVVQSHNVTRAATPEERAVAIRLVRGAADHARAAGHTALYWDDPENHLDARATAELGAAECEEIGRRWTVRPLAAWTVPAGLLPATIRTVPSESPEPPDSGALTAYADFFTDVTGQPHTPEAMPLLLWLLPPVVERDDDRRTAVAGWLTGGFAAVRSDARPHFA